jgi:hypothetical protein
MESKKFKRGAYDRVWRGLCLARDWSMESGGQFIFGAFGKNLALVAMKTFSHSLYFVKNI